MQQEVPGAPPIPEVDLAQHPNAQKLLRRCQDFFAEVENLYVSRLPLPPNANKTTLELPETSSKRT
jgi:hypothetical protein